MSSILAKVPFEFETNTNVSCKILEIPEKSRSGF